MARHYNIDYRDRWRFDEHGVRKLTLRMIAVRIMYLPADSACARLMNDGRPLWGTSENLLADVYGALAGKEHPGRSKTHSRPDPDRDSKLRAARARAAERRRLIEAGEIT